MSYETIRVDREGSIGRLTFNRPEVLNAYNKTLATETIQGFNELVADPTIRVIVLTGTGKAFMAGADINMVNEWARQGEVAKIRATLRMLVNPNMFEDCPKPTIAAVNGLAFGMGCEIAMACDYRIAADNAQFGQPEIKLGIIPGAGGSQRLMRLVGATKALEMISIGDPIDAQEAYRIGLVNQVVPAEGLWEAVNTFAGKLASKGAVALDICKKLIYQGGDLSLRQGIEYEQERFCEILLTDDAREGTQAFLEKRKPNFNRR
ncbi:MAG: enoyl-CoA hydratase [Desulfuromonadales bacterium]|nr:enoyl-CoA hydratase [Desulfuromonadales bacterium]